MDQAEFDQIKATFPWTQRVLQTPLRGHVQVIDCNGNEVPIFTMTSFLVMITAKLAAKEAVKEAEKETT